ncbi:hypothetical protein JEM67_16080 [Serratia sp. PAMC26656]|uniref:hypothetical protein n=1 Tax=Serratia sp. PAMC26656 TaxID=2775909 RepID=UPI0018F444C5|nr:hypothetical protein [Serratia sp. PAMC26656]MBJ7889426.1 hypothetical protein [Serratia sp. PAMC26656]
MNPIEFIRKNVVTQLVGEGFPEDVARGAEEAVDLYRRMSQASRKGRIYDDCLTQARQYCRFHTPKHLKGGSNGKRGNRAV